MWAYGVWHHILGPETFAELASDTRCPILLSPSEDARPDTLVLGGVVPWDDELAPAIALARAGLAPAQLARLVWQGAAFTLRGCETFAAWRYERSCLVAVPGVAPRGEVVPVVGDPRALVPKLASVKDRLAADGEPVPPGWRLARSFGRSRLTPG